MGWDVGVGNEKSGPRVLPGIPKWGKATSAAFIWKLAGKLTLSLLGTHANTKFSEPNTLFSQPLKPSRRAGRGRGGGGARLPFHLGLVPEEA